jgi:hypothetical protein
LTLRKKLLLLNVVLLALIAAVSWRLRQEWREARAREQKVLRQALKPVPAPPVSALPQPKPVTAAAYDDIAQKVLFSKDRNPVVTIEVAPPKPLPPFPVSHGVMNLGDGPMILLSEQPGKPHRAYTPGDKIGEYKLVAANNEEIVLEFDGRQVKKRLDELIDRSAKEEPSPAPGAARRSSAAQPAAQHASPAAGSQSGPGVVMSGEVRACLPGDTAPAGTVSNGLRKVITESPFGKVCRWEPVR